MKTELITCFALALLCLRLLVELSRAKRQLRRKRKVVAYLRNGWREERDVNSVLLFNSIMRRVRERKEEWPETIEG